MIKVIILTRRNNIRTTIKVKGSIFFIKFNLRIDLKKELILFLNEKNVKINKLINKVPDPAIKIINNMEK